jgi:hypothetical protein
MSGTSSLKEFSIAFPDDEEGILTGDAHVDLLSLRSHSDAATPAQGGVTWARLQAESDMVEVADVDEVEALVQEAALIQLRELHSFSHTARLFFHSHELKFYAAIYMDNLLWRAMKSSDFDAAEKAFEEFSAQVNQRARSEVRRVQLDAANVQLERVVAESQARAERLRANIQRNAVQKQRALDRESDLRKNIKQLESTRVQTQLQAGRLFRQIGQLHSTCAAQLPRFRGGLVGFRKSSRL